MSDWLIAFNRATVTRTITWSAAERQEWLERPIALFRSIFGSTDGREQLFAEMRSWAGSCDGRSLPLVITHNDLGPWNVHHDGVGVTVIDWEIDDSCPSDREGLPLTDLVYFATHWLYTALRLRGGDGQIGAFRRLIDPAGQDVLTRAARSALVLHTERLGIDRRFIPLLVLLTWIERATDRSRRSDQVAEDPAAIRYRRYVDVIAERGPAFFPELSRV